MAESLVKEFLNVVKLSKIEGAPELVLDSILNHFGYDDCDLNEGVERLYTMGKIKHTFRSVLNKGEDMPAILDWFKGSLGLTDEAIAEETGKIAAYAADMLELGKKYAGMGHCISSQTYFELAAENGNEEAKGILADRAYAKKMCELADRYLGMGHCISGKTYLELAAAKGCPKAAAKLADMAYAKKMCELADRYLGMGHVISGKTYLELAAAKGCPKAAAKLADFNYAAKMVELGDRYAAMGHKIAPKTYYELAAAKGCPKAAAKLAAL